MGCLHLLKIKRKIVQYILVFVMVFSSVFTAYVQPVFCASLVSDIANFIYGSLIQKGISVGGDSLDDFTSWLVGKFIPADGSLDSFFQAFADYNDWEPCDGVPRDSQDNYVLSETYLDALRDLFDEYLAATPEAVDVVWLPVISSDKVSASWFYSLQGYQQFRSWTDNENLTFVYANQLRNVVDDYYVTTYYTAFSDASDMVFIHGNSVTSAGCQTWANLIPYSNLWLSNWGNSSTTCGTLGGIIPFRSDGVAANFQDFMPSHMMRAVDSCDVLTVSDYISYPENGMGNYIYQYPFNSVSSAGFHHSNLNKHPPFILVRGCNTDAPAFVPLFRNVNVYKDWITGQGSYYKFDSGYTGGDITINPNADYSAITDAIADVMKQSIANGDTMSTMLSHMQAAFSKTLAEISGTLGDIGDNTAETNSWLEKIFGLLETQQKEMQEYFKSAQESLDQIPDQISSSAQDITNAIQDTGQAIVDAISGITAGGGGSPPVIAPGDYPDGDQIDSSSGKSLWTLLGEGIAKIITAILNLLKVLIFKGLDALGYLAGVMIDNIGDVFSGIGEYFDRYIGYIEENTFFAGISDILPEELQTIMVLTFFSVAIAGIIKYAKKG